MTDEEKNNGQIGEVSVPDSQADVGTDAENNSGDSNAVVNEADGSGIVDSSSVSATAEKTTEKKEKTASKKSKKNKGMGPARIIVLIICIGVFAFSAYKIAIEIRDNINTGSQTEDLIKIITADEEDTVGVEKYDDKGQVVPHSGSTLKDDLPDENPSTDPEPVTDSGTTESETDQDDVENVSNTGEDTSEDASKTENENSEEVSSEETKQDVNESSDSTEKTNQTVDEDKNKQENNTGKTDNSDSYNDVSEDEAKANEEPEQEERYASRPKSDIEKAQTGVVIAPQDISLDEITYLKASNLKKLKKSINPDCVGWFYVPGSKSEAYGMPIDQPIVQTTDNDFYLEHSFYLDENQNGAIFFDFRNDTEYITSNYNTIVYGHARSYRMFGGLKNLNKAEKWYSNGYNHFIKINTETEETVWQIFSWYETDIYDDYIATDFSSKLDFIRFCYNLQDKNQIEGAFQVFDFDENSRILTLSTCKGTNQTVRVAVHAKLVKLKTLTD